MSDVIERFGGWEKMNGGCRARILMNPTSGDLEMALRNPNTRSLCDKGVEW
jgi:hypothetical protein